jgi:hypothetical protein
MLSFRDHLRRDDGDRRLYEPTKRELASRPWKYVQQDANAKSETVEQMMRRADRPQGSSAAQRRRRGRELTARRTGDGPNRRVSANSIRISRRPASATAGPGAHRNRSPC